MIGSAKKSLRPVNNTIFNYIYFIVSDIWVLVVPLENFITTFVLANLQLQELSVKYVELCGKQTKKRSWPNRIKTRGRK